PWRWRRPAPASSGSPRRCSWTTTRCAASWTDSACTGSSPTTTSSAPCSTCPSCATCRCRPGCTAGSTTWPGRWSAPSAESERDPGLLVEEPGGVQQLLGVLGGGIGVELHHVHRVGGGDDDRLLPDDPLDTVLVVTTADLDRVETAQRGGGAGTAEIGRAH